MIGEDTRGWAGESKWKKSDHPTTVWASIMADNNIATDTSGKSISAMCGSEVRMERDGSEHLASYSGMYLLDYARIEQSGGGSVNTG